MKNVYVFIIEDEEAARAVLEEKSWTYGAVLDGPKERAEVVHAIDMIQSGTYVEKES